MLFNTITQDNQSSATYYVEERNVYGKTFKIVCFNSRSTRYKIAKDIILQMDIDKVTSEKESVYSHTYSIQLYSERNNYNDLIMFVNKCKELFDLQSVEKQNIYLLDSFKDETQQAVYTMYPFQSTKHFNTMFFKEKNDVLERIDKFVNGENEYKRLGIPWTLGFMFYGLPGTGKTSAAKAIARYTDRHIIIIPMKKIDNISCLRNIFMNEQINGYTIPNKKRLYVFDEIDCGEWRDIVNARNKNTTEPESNNVVETLTSLLIEKKDEDKSIKKKERISLGDFLELLDGMVEMHGRMIIMTSNHPEELDPALLRPGRVDMLLEFTKMRAKDIASMYKLWFDEDLPETVHIQDNVFTQAEIGNIFQTRNFEQIYSKLTSS
jgi:SpoVK/Ycf46/Vps4 family AAA+-type ATPase